MKSMYDYPRETWRRYRVHYSGGMFPHRDVDAPNKTCARRLVGGELRAGLKITKIEEVHHAKAE